MNTNRMRGLLLALIGSFALAVPAGAAAQTAPPQPAQAAAGSEVPAPFKTAHVRALKKQIRKHRVVTRHWQRVMGRPTTAAGGKLTTTSVRYLTWLRGVWRVRASRARARARRVPHRASWLCIHRHEGAWNDPNAPYYGGLQMDLSFQRAYGRYLLNRKGTANRWRPLEQMWTAERARRSGRGFHPWPVTARRCGLI